MIAPEPILASAIREIHDLYYGIYGLQNRKNLFRDLRPVNFMVCIEKSN